MIQDMVDVGSCEPPNVSVENRSGRVSRDAEQDRTYTHIFDWNVCAPHQTYFAYHLIYIRPLLWIFP